MAEENQTTFHNPMDPTKPLVVYTKKQECCQAFTEDAGNPITMVNTVQMGMMHVVAMGVMQDAYCRWKCIPKPDQSWNCWKEHFNNAFNELRELNAITAESMGYGAKNITNNMVTTDAAMSLDNLASAAMSKVDAISMLAAANKKSAEALAPVKKDNEKLLNMVSQLTTDTMKAKPQKQGIPYSYYWTHGFVMGINHNNKTCNNKALVHKIEAT